MRITDISFQHLRNPSLKLQAFVTITFDDCLVVSDFRLFSKGRSFHLAMPSRKGKDGSYRDVVFPISTAFQEYLQQTVLRAYTDERAKPEFSSPPS